MNGSYLWNNLNINVEPVVLTIRRPELSRENSRNRDWAFSPVPPAECLESLQQHRIDMCSSAAIHNTEKIDKIHLVELSPSIFSK